MTIVNDDSRVVNKLEASLTDDARVVIYDCQVFIVQQATGANPRGGHRSTWVGSLLANILLSWKGLPRANTLDYLGLFVGDEEKWLKTLSGFLFVA